MGNRVMRCFVGVAVIRVMRPNGRIDEFDFPVMASEVMQRYPQHLVIHSNYIGRDASLEQQRRKISIVRPETKLLPGLEYILYPIPPQYRETVAQSFAKQLSRTHLNPEGEPEPTQQLKRTLRRRSHILEATRHHLATILRSARDSKLGDERFEKKVGGWERNPPTCTQGGESGNVINDEDDDEEFSFYCSASWKPSLHSIPESPSTSQDWQGSISPSTTDELEHG